ncbi:hypothetical protein Emed_007413 [Eimeria media]
MGGPFASDASAAAGAAAVAAATTAAAAAAGAAAAAAATAAAAAPQRSRGAPSLRLYLTGFGPFGEITENPSGVLVEALAAALDGCSRSSQSTASLQEKAAAAAAATHQQPPANHQGGPPLQHLSCIELCGSEVLEVSADAAKEAATRIHRLLRGDTHQAARGPPSPARGGPPLPLEGGPFFADEEAPLCGAGGPLPVEGAPLSAVGDPQGIPAAGGTAARVEAEALMPGIAEEKGACDKEAPKPLCLAIHFGVNAKCSVWMLEKAAKNDARFPCKDTKGCVPESREICCSMPFEARLRCGLPLEDVAAALEQRGHPCSTSEDAGCFVCNYLYFKSLQEAGSSGATALFVHVSFWLFCCSSRPYAAAAGAAASFRSQQQLAFMAQQQKQQKQQQQQALRCCRIRPSAAAHFEA